ncbi:MAG TPA: glycosyltransferase family 4 protein [Bryobacteraceae bacterium]|nr:glycosyltransferase family 4 protein [Bryobacteraceae bacterium]
MLPPAILLIDQFGELGGAQRCLLEAAMGFLSRGWNLSALVPAHGPLAGALAACSVPVEPIPCGPFHSGRKSPADALRFARQLPLQAAAIARAVRRRRPGLVYVNGPRMLAAAALARMGRPLLYHAHWMPPQPSASRLARRLLRWSRASVIASSRLASDWLRGSVAPERVFLVYNGVAVSSAPRPPRDRIERIGLLGRISPEKGQLEFARAARKVSQRIRGLRFIVSGAPMFSDRAYFQQARAEARGSVEFRGWTDDLPAFLQEIDLLVVPSLHDNLPRVIMEAFAAGVPVLAFDSGAIPEVVEHGQTGLLIRERSEDALARAILVASAQPDQLQQMAARAQARWRERYSLPRFQSEICAAVETVLRRSHQRNPLERVGPSARA